MTTVDRTDGTKSAPQRVSRGVRFLGCDVRLSDISFALGTDGTPRSGSGRVR
jgi:hypothetical protein